MARKSGNRFSEKAMLKSDQASVRFMLRFKILISVVPLLAAAILARIEFFPGTRPCVAVGENTLQIAAAPWHADLHVSFTNDPAAATVRVKLTDSAESADFAVVDDVDGSEDSACAMSPATRFVAVTAKPFGSAPVIYLSQGGRADYRIFVHSKRFTAREAAALIVGAHGGHPRLADASL
jgi:hypothetical protein